MLLMCWRKENLELSKLAVHEPLLVAFSQPIEAVLRNAGDQVALHRAHRDECRRTERPERALPCVQRMAPFWMRRVAGSRLRHPVAVVQQLPVVVIAFEDKQVLARQLRVQRWVYRRHLLVAERRAPVVAHLDAPPAVGEVRLARLRELPRELSSLRRRVREAGAQLVERRVHVACSHVAHKPGHRLDVEAHVPRESAAREEQREHEIRDELVARVVHYEAHREPFGFGGSARRRRTLT